jgi:hypothetical protein
MDLSSAALLLYYKEKLEILKPLSKNFIGFI